MVIRFSFYSGGIKTTLVNPHSFNQSIILNNHPILSFTKMSKFLIFLIITLHLSHSLNKCDELISNCNNALVHCSDSAQSHSEDCDCLSSHFQCLFLQKTNCDDYIVDTWGYYCSKYPEFYPEDDCAPVCQVDFGNGVFSLLSWWFVIIVLCCW